MKKEEETRKADGEIIRWEEARQERKQEKQTWTEGGRRKQ